MKKVTLIVVLFTSALCIQCQNNSKPNSETIDYSNVDYSARSNIIKNPEKLKGDEKTIFYHSYFLKLTYKETKDLEPLKVKEEFLKLGITTDQRARFVAAYTFLDTDIVFHKKSCEQWESFKDLGLKND